MPLVAMRASVREVLPWSYLLDQDISFEGYQMGYLRHGQVYRSIIASAYEMYVDSGMHTFLTSLALR